MRQLLKPEFLRLTLVVTSVWVCLSFAALSNDFLLIRFFKDTARERLQRPLSLAQYVSKLVGGVLGASVIDRLGRKRVLAPCFVVTALGTLALVHVREDASVFASVALLYSANEVLWSTLMTYTCEAFPTAVRMSGLGVSIAVGRLSASLSVAIGPPLMELAPSFPFGINALVLVLGALLSSSLPSETSGKAMR
jgi:putative MFS transporter